MRHRFTKVMLGAALFMLLAGTATVAAKSQGSSASTASYKIGFIYPRTGALASYGAEEIQGFKLGLQYATKGTNKVNGKTLDITYVDDKGDAATGVTAAKDLIGQGTKILMGTGSSGVAVQIAPLAAQNQVLYISGSGFSARHTPDVSLGGVDLRVLSHQRDAISAKVPAQFFGDAADYLLLVDFSRGDDDKVTFVVSVRGGG